MNSSRRRFLRNGLLIAGGMGVIGWASYLGWRRHKEKQFFKEARIQLRQIGLGMHNYHDSHQCFPPSAIFDPDGKPLLSWRVLLLPFFGKGMTNKQFRQNEPWDSPHNLPFVHRMPPVFQPFDRPDLAAQGLTYYRVFVGPGTCFEGTKGIPLTRIQNNPSWTILVVEAGDPVLWTKPDEELECHPDKPLPKLGGSFPSRSSILFATADGVADEFPRDIGETELRKMILRHDPGSFS